MANIISQVFMFGNVSYHKFEEKPGLLESAFPHTSTAHHPLKGQLFMEELELIVKVEIQRERSEGIKRHDERINLENVIRGDMKQNFSGFN